MLQRITYKDPKGKTRQWEGVERTTRRGDIDAVAILAIVTGGGAPRRIILESQWRPAPGNTVIEVPAGLLDEGESPEDAALRELKEETGYSGVVRRVGGTALANPGMTGEALAFVEVHVDADSPENATVRPELEEGEFIDVFLLPLEGLHDQLLDIKQEKGWDVDSRLLMYAAGLADGAAAAVGSRPAEATPLNSSAGNGGQPAAGDGFRESVARSLSRVGSAITLSRAASREPLPPPAAEVGMAQPGSYASLRGLDADGDSAAESLGHPDSLHPADSARGPKAILMSPAELAAAGIEAVRIVPRGTLRWRRLDRTLLVVGGVGLLAGMCLSQVAAGMALVIGMNYHPRGRLYY